MWLISAECHELLDAIPVLVADPKKDGDIIKTDSIADDIADTARYGLKSMLSPRGIPREVELDEKLKAVRQRFAGQTDATPAPEGTDPFTHFGGRKIT